jgi:hypothetical protein
MRFYDETLARRSGDSAAGAGSVFGSSVRDGAFMLDDHLLEHSNPGRCTLAPATQVGARSLEETGQDREFLVDAHRCRFP